MYNGAVEKYPREPLQENLRGLFVYPKAGECIPRKPKRPCSYPECRELVDGQYCDKHMWQKDKEYERYRRDKASRRLYNNRLQKAGRIFLNANPYCEECKRIGKIIPVTVVDHIIPHKGNRDLFWDDSNWQAMCKRCHDTKTAKEDGRWRR